VDEFPEDDEGLLKGIRFIVSPQLDPSLRDLVERIIPLATYYTSISTFVELRSHLDYGLVNHALCASIRDMLKDYQTLLSQLEHAFNTSSTFTLQKLWFYIHPTLHTMSLIYSLIVELSQTDSPDENSDEDASSDDDALNEELGLASGLKAVKLSEMGIGGGGIVKGGEVVAILWDRMQNMSGDPTAYTLYGKLLKAAGKPYSGLVERWIRTGSLKDPYEELMIKESKFINRGTLEMDYTDEYWERRYTVSSYIDFSWRHADRALVKRRLESVGPFETTSIWCSPSKNGWWSITRRCMYTAIYRELETQDPPCGQISQRHSRMWY
jgi:gamma-tubulin complex component 2